MKRIFPILLAFSVLASGCGQKSLSMGSKMVTAITLDSETVEVRVGETWPLSVSFEPAGASSTVDWQTSDPAVATINSVGTVLGVSEGTATVFAYSKSNFDAVASCEITVLPPPEPDVLVTSVTLSETKFELAKGSSLDLSPYLKVLPDNATNKKVNWTSSDVKVVLPSPTGRVSAMGAGTAVIRATAADASGLYAACTITVPEPAAPTGCCEGCTCGCGGSGKCPGCSGGGSGPSPGDDDPATDPDLVLFHACDDLTFVHTGHMSGLSLQTLGRQQGKAYIMRTCGGDPEILIINRPTASDVIDSKIENFSKGHLLFWFFIDNATELRKRAAIDGRIEISDSNDPNHALAWSSKTYLADKVSDGWNLIDLPFSEGRDLNPSHRLNQHATKYFRIYFNGSVSSVEMTFGIDAIGFKEDK